MSNSRITVKSTKWLRIVAVLSIVMSTLAPLTWAAPVLADSLNATASFNPAFARQGQSVTLTVTVNSTAKCVVVTGDHTATQKIQTGPGTLIWTFGFTAPTGDGVRTVQATAYSSPNCPSGNIGFADASYNLDNTSPIVTGSLSPAPNGAGWNKNDVTITWTATDSGSGVSPGFPVPPSDSVTANTGAAGIVKTSTAVDLANNVGQGTVTVRLDKNAPTITGSRSPAANSFGWNNTDVTVDFSCVEVGPSGLKSCSGATTLGNSSANQSVTGTAVDTADNSSSTTVSGINIDKIAPTLSGAPTTGANAAGWYNSNVTVSWNCADALSGIDGACPPNSTITGEGTGLRAGASVSDKAGNTTTSTSSPAVQIDSTAPTTMASAPPAWNNTNVIVNLVAFDGASGVRNTYYTLDGGAQQTGVTVPITTEGIHDLLYWSDDLAGNTEAPKTVQVKIDRTSPTISHTQNPAANVDGWNNTIVTVTFSCDDSLSGIATCTAPQTVSSDGLAQLVTGTATDNAGNTATDPVRVNVDRTAPTIGASRAPASGNANGWNNEDVVVSFTCADGLSGIAANGCPHPQTISEGSDVTVSGTATDSAGNTASTSVAGIKVDKVAPTLSGAPTTAANGDGWYRGDVTVVWTCGDDRSGVAVCPPNGTITGEGSNLAESASVSDRAGNTTSASVTGIKIDRTKPTTSVNTPLGWQNDEVALTLSSLDNLSGVKATYYKLNGGSAQTGTSLSIGANGTHTLEYWSEDVAGNVETVQSVQIRIDRLSPTISPSQTPAANATGWNNSDVTITFTCIDQPNLSGVASCTDPQTVSSEGQAQIVTGMAVDNAGNTAAAPVTVNIDKTAPTITAERVPTGGNSFGWNNEDVVVNFTCNDELSGIGSCPPAQMLGEGTNQTASGTAIDNAGNSTSTSIGDINVDKTPPALSSAPTSPPNDLGWYNANVIMTWLCSDDSSGIDGACPADSTISGEGEGLMAGASVSDKAGNSTTVRSAPVRIDREVPNTVASAPSDWQNSAATVTLTPNDALSGVRYTYYRLDNDGQLTYNSSTGIRISTEGIHTISYWSVDNASNIEPAKTAQVLIDQTAPTISHTIAPVPNTNGWNRTNATVTFICADALSGIRSCTPAQLVTTEGQNQNVHGEAIDNANNTAIDDAKVSLDRTAPTITAALDRLPNVDDWYNDDVTVSFTCSDSLSGVDVCPPAQTKGEGGAQTASGTATDAAGNTATATINNINVDKTAPTLSGAATTAPNSEGWYRGDVTVHWTCADTLSGLATGACPPNSTITGEGNDLSASAQVSDRADNSTNATVSGIKIDRTAPSTSSNAPEGWNNVNVTVSLSSGDSLSGVAATYYKLNGDSTQSGTSITINTQGVNTLEYWSADKAGNTETAKTVEVKIDKTDPTITSAQAPAKNGNGWNNTDVTVTFTCADQPGLSGVATCTGVVNGVNEGVVIGSEGENQPVPGAATDNAGNTASITARASIDKAAPSIAAHRGSDPNTFGWNNTDVTVSFTCADSLSGIPVGGCPGSQTKGEGANQSVSGTATDAAGNTAPATISNINVDKTAPTLSGAATTAPNGADWYRSDVTVHWTCADQAGLSGIDGNCPSDSIITSEGSNLSATESVSDKAGNTTGTTVSGIKIDRTDPQTSASAPSGWQNNHVTVSLTGVDGLSGVASTYYRLDGDATQSGTSIVITTEGTHTVSYWSVDRAGNTETANTVQVQIDLSNPTISHTIAPVPNTNGWNRTNATVTFICADAVSGILSCTPPQTVTTEGQNQPVPGTAVDNAGNTNTDPAEVSIDRTAPTITAALDRLPNVDYWYNDDVTVSFTCSDSLSGIPGGGCPPAQTKGEGGAQTASGTATDAAGNTATATINNINVDKTAPTLSGAATTAPNSEGWYRGDVTVHWTCADTLSGLATGACPPNSTITGEGNDLSASAQVSDRADNSTNATVSGIKIDRTAPSTSSNAPEGWRNASVTVSLTGVDGLSGVASTYYRLDGGETQSGTSIVITTEGTHTVSYWSVDRAGNTETANTVQVQIDLSNPTITGAPTTSPNAAGWYRSDVTIHWTCADQQGLSGIATGACPPNSIITGEGDDLSASASVSDRAGNSTPATVSSIKIDRTSPSITFNGVASGQEYILGITLTPSCSAVDALSGPVGCTGTVSGGTTNGVGLFTYTATAIDVAGNTTTQSITYRVLYRWDGFLQPINDTAHQVGVSTSIFRANSTVPVKFELKRADGTIVQSANLPVWLTPARGSTTNAAPDESVYGEPGDTGSTYRVAGGQYIYNWRTSANQAGSYWRVGVRLEDGKTYYVNIGLR